MLYTHLSYSQIKELTIPQYTDIIAMIQRKQMWDLQNYTVAMSGEFDEDINPLYTLEEDMRKQKMTVDDVQQLMSMLK